MRAVALSVCLAACRASTSAPEASTPSREVMQPTSDPPRAPGSLVPVPATVEQVQREGTGDVATRLRVRTDALRRRDPPLATAPPTQSPTADGAWRAPDGAPITVRFVVGWSRPREVEGQPLTVYFAARSAAYWVQQAGGLSTDVTWYGPFALDAPSGATP